MKHEGVEYYLLVTTCWHAPPLFISLDNTLISILIDYYYW